VNSKNTAWRDHSKNDLRDLNNRTKLHHFRTCQNYELNLQTETIMRLSDLLVSGASAAEKSMYAPIEIASKWFEM